MKRSKSPGRTVVLAGLMIGLFCMSAGLAVGAPAPGGELVVAKPTDPQSLDPQLDSGGPSSEIQYGVLENLVSFDANMELRPELATSWDISADGRTYTFSLRRGVKFHDGTDFNADAVKFMVERSMGKIDGKKNRYLNLIQPLQSVEVVDRYTVRMILKSPFAPFLNSLAHTGFSIFSPTAFNTMGAAFGQAPVGTGPFKVVKWTKGQSIVIEKNPDYWKSGVPLLERITFRILPDAQTRIAALRAGEVDFVLQIPENLYTSINAVPQIAAIKTPTLRTVFFQFNPTKAPFDDVNVRKAFCHLIDNELIANTILEGLHFPAEQPTQPYGVWGIARGIQPYTYDPDLAARALEASGWRKDRRRGWMKDGQPLSFTLWTTTNRYPQDSTIAVAIKSILEGQGMQVEVQTREWGAYRDSIFNKEFQVYLFGAGASTGDVDYVYSTLFASTSRYSQKPSAAEPILNEARTTPQEEERLRLSREFQQVIRDEYLWNPIYWMSQLLAMKDSVQDFEPRQDEQLDFSTVWLQK
ncbi:MAG: hypothetical protein JXB06_08180 [Spirochaetales bacterium]|nr:hypothetical protein [Spirochaetales bacterium]